MILYTPDDYNQHNVLHVPTTLVLISFYLLKHYLIFALPMMANLPMIQKVARPLLTLMPSHEYTSGALLYSCIPALLVIISMARRLPKTGPFLRWIWHRGRLLLLSSLGLEIGFILLYVALGIKKFNEVSLMFIYIDVVIIVYLFKSERIHDVFTEFPKFNPN